MKLLQRFRRRRHSRGEFRSILADALRPVVSHPRRQRQRPLASEPLERRDLLTVIEILAAGVRNEETIELRIDDVLRAEFQNIGGDAYGGTFERLEFTTPETVTADQIKIAFTNDFYDEPNGVDRNVRIDAVILDGQRFEAEAPTVFSTGTWKPEDGIVAGFRQSEFLHSDGYFQFEAATVNGSQITVRAAGSEGVEQFELRIDNTTVGSYSVSTEFQTFVYRDAGPVDPSQVRVVFINDDYRPDEGIDNNLLVDFITIDGVVYETEAANVFSTGTWKPEDGIEPGFRESEVLHTSGYFQYAQSLQPGIISLESSVLSVSEGDASALIRVLRSGGSDGRVTVDYRTVAVTATAGVDFEERVGTLVFEDGETLRVIEVPLIEDTLIEADEQFSFAIDNVLGGASLLAPRTATVTIDDNDSIQASGDGLLGEYFDGPAFTSRFLNRVDTVVDFAWGTGVPVTGMGPDDFSVRWSGQIEPRYSELYTFETFTDDGVRLWVDDQLIVDQWIDQSPTAHTGSIALNAGQLYDIRMEYYERGGGAVARLRWSSASQAVEVVPRSQLYAADPPPPSPGGELQTQTLVTGLVQPTSLDFSPDGTLMFIAEQRGIVRVSQNGVLLANPFLDFRDRVNGTRDRGLLDIAVHPDFANQPYFYLLYTYDPPEVNNQSSGTLAGPDGRGNRAGRLTRVTADAATGYTTIVPGSEVVLVGNNSTWDNFNAFVNSTANFTEPPAGILPDGTNLQDFIATDSESHTVGSIEFGLDGSLFATIGDGTSYNRVDPRTVRVQDIDNLSGKILRIDPITGEGLDDNPFFNGDPNANRSKVYQLGVRNAFRSAVNPNDGRLYVGDVGWTQWEEINVGAPGDNFGWPYFEGGSGNSLRTNGYRDLPEAIEFYNSGSEATPSLYALNHAASGINAIVLGDFYTGEAYPPEYQGDLFFNDLGQGIVRNINFAPDGTIESVDTFATGANIVVQIKQGPDDNLYFVDLDNGTVGRWVFTDGTTASVSASPSPASPTTPLSIAPSTGAGSDVIIAAIDSGLSTSVWGSNLWTNAGEIPDDGIDNDSNGYVDDYQGYSFISQGADITDTLGHGTFIASLLQSTSQFGAQLMPLQAFGADGRGSTANIAEAIRYAAAQDADVIVLPFETTASEALREAVRFAEGRGAFVVAAAGNLAAESPSFIAALSSEFSNVISVGALSASGTLLPESNRVGTSRAVQMDAPGIATAVSIDGPATYRGTSVAAAKVAALAAQILAINPSLRPSQVRDVLTSTRNTVASGSDSAGTINSDAAVALAMRTNEIIFNEIADRVSVLGSAGDDTFTFTIDTGMLTINGVGYSNTFASDLSKVLVRGLGGTDRLTIHGSNEAETAILRPGYARLIGESSTIVGTTLEHVTIISGGGADQLTMQGSVDEDSGELSPNFARLRSGDSSTTGIGFSSVLVDGLAGTDAIAVGDSIGVDRFVLRPNNLLWKADGIEYRTRRFENTTITSASAEDIAIVHGSNDSDEFYASPTEGIATNDSFRNVVLNMSHVYFRGNGATDSIVFTGGIEDERYNADSQQARFWSDQYFVSARGIEQRVVDGGAGRNVAFVRDSAQDDTLRLLQSSAELRSGSRGDILTNFSSIHANSMVDDGLDVIELLASDLNYAFKSSGDWQQSSGLAAGAAFFLEDDGASDGLLDGETLGSSSGNSVIDSVYDVNGDGLISPLDALLVITKLNSKTMEGTNEDVNLQEQDLLLDTSGDGLVSPLDVLLVIDWLNKKQAE